MTTTPMSLAPNAQTEHGATQADPRPASVAKLPQLIKLSRWLDITYREDAPRIETARRWAREGRISPRPVKHGREFFVQPGAVYVPVPIPANAAGGREGGAQ